LSQAECFLSSKLYRLENTKLFLNNQNNELKTFTYVFSIAIICTSALAQINFLKLEESQKKLTTMVDDLKINSDESQNKLTLKVDDLKVRYDVAGYTLIGTGFIFAGAGNIVKILEYFDKKLGSKRVIFKLTYV
jgi:hypothetical protein